jgi:acetolactate synthase-1/2/3 large subunit
VVLALPEDMLTETAEVADAEPTARFWPSATTDDVARARALLAKAERPLLMLGGSTWTDEGVRRAIAFAEGNGLPTCVSFRRQDLFRSDSPVYAGDIGTSGPPELVRRFKEADVLLVVGARLGEMTTQGYTTLGSPEPRQTLIHVHPDADELGRVFRPTLGVVSSGDGFMAAAAAMPKLDSARWRGEAEKARRDYLGSLEPPPYNGAFDFPRAMRGLATMLPKDAITTVDAGNHSGWPQRYLDYGRPQRQLGPTSGAMGYSVPAAVAASLVHPDRVVVGFVGDGGFGMCGFEIATALQHGGRRSSSAPTTSCTARSACTRSATTPSAWSAPISPAPASPRWRARSAATASG